MSKEYAFFIYLLERYAEYKQVSAQKVLAMWAVSYTHLTLPTKA